MEELLRMLIEDIGLSTESVRALIDEFGESAVQTHAMRCLYAMDQGRVKNPPAWFTASLKNNWSAPYGMPNNWLPTVMHFRLDEHTFVEIERDMREERMKDRMHRTQNP